MNDTHPSTPEPREPRERRLALAARALMFASLACLAWAGWTLAHGAVVEAVDGRRLERALAEADARDPFAADARAAEVAPTPPPAWGELAEGDLVGRIRIDRLDLSAIVHAGTSRGTLRRAVGHIPGTARPGEGGNVGLAGHRDSFFRPLAEVRTGDTIRLATPHGRFRYRVEEVLVVDPDEVWVLAPPDDGHEVVTLVSCYPFYWVGPAPRRFVVQGRRLHDPPTP